MSYSHRVGHILDEVKTGLILQQVNAQGKMGSGFAKAIRDKWPKVWDEYSAVIKPNQPYKGQEYMGQVIFVEVEPDLWVGNIVGQQFYGREEGVCYTNYLAMWTGITRSRNFAKFHRLHVHYPLIGCGLAGGNWTTVSRIIDNRFVTINHSLWELPT